MSYKPNRCAKCAYGVMISISHIKHDACYYLIRTGKRRPCPAGDKCTEFKPKGKETKTIWSLY